MNRYTQFALVYVLYFPVLIACSTPPAVLQLAEKTAANAGVISAHTNRLAEESNNIAELRAANIARLHAANTSLRASYNYDLELTRQSGGTGNLTLIRALEDWGKKVEDIFKRSTDAEGERKTEILKNQTKLDTKSEMLAKIGQALATLAKEEPTGDRARFLAGYAQELTKELDGHLKQNNKSATNATKLLDKVKGKF